MGEIHHHIAHGGECGYVGQQIVGIVSAVDATRKDGTFEHGLLRQESTHAAMETGDADATGWGSPGGAHDRMLPAPMSPRQSRAPMAGLIIR
jgi:hypothetical protein